MLFAMLLVLAGVPVSGRVVDAQTQNPVAGARVMLFPTQSAFPPEAFTPQQVMTDANGQFTFDSVAPGRYRIDVQRTGFAPLADPSSAAMLEVTASQPVANLELRLKKGGVLAGRIVDGRGDPLPSMTVTALRSASSDPVGVMGITTGMAETNDLGEFRIASLPEGDYLLIAVPMPLPPFGQAGGAAGVVFAPTYYPGTTDRDAAQTISLAAQQTISDLQFALISTPAYQVSGVVVDEAGALLNGVTLTLIDSRNAGPRAPAIGHTDANGTFTIGGVVPGTYQVMAGTSMMWSSRDGGAGVGDTGFIDAGFIAVAGGVYVGGASVGGPGVPLPASMPVAVGGRMPAMVMQTSIEVTVDNADVRGLKVVLTATRP